MPALAGVRFLFLAVAINVFWLRGVDAQDEVQTAAAGNLSTLPVVSFVVNDPLHYLGGGGVGAITLQNPEHARIVNEHGGLIHRGLSALPAVDRRAPVRGYIGANNTLILHGEPLKHDPDSPPLVVKVTRAGEGESARINVLFSTILPEAHIRRVRRSLDERNDPAEAMRHLDNLFQASQEDAVVTVGPSLTVDEAIEGAILDFLRHRHPGRPIRDAEVPILAAKAERIWADQLSRMDPGMVERLLREMPSLPVSVRERTVDELMDVENRNGKIVVFPTGIDPGSFAEYVKEESGTPEVVRRFRDLYEHEQRIPLNMLLEVASREPSNFLGRVFRVHAIDFLGLPENNVPAANALLRKLELGDHADRLNMEMIAQSLLAHALIPRMETDIGDVRLGYLLRGLALKDFAEKERATTLDNPVAVIAATLRYINRFHITGPPIDEAVDDILRSPTGRLSFTGNEPREIAVDPSELEDLKTLARQYRVWTSEPRHPKQ